MENITTNPINNKMLLTINNKNAYLRVTPSSGVGGATRIRNQSNENFHVLMIKTK